MDKFRDPSDNRVRGLSKWFFPNGSFEMRACEVISFDEIDERFIIQWGNGRTKKVSRFNL